MSNKRENYKRYMSKPGVREKRLQYYKDYYRKHREERLAYFKAYNENRKAQRRKSHESTDNLWYQRAKK